MPAELGKISENALLDNSGVARQKKIHQGKFQCLLRITDFYSFWFHFLLLGFALF